MLIKKTVKRIAFLTLCVSVGPVLCPAHATALNDTGQQACYDGTALAACTGANTGDAALYPRQDGRYGRDAAAAVGALSKSGGSAAGFDFTALDATGNPTAPASGANPHSCVRDNVTGLIWEVKTDDGGLRDKDWNYSWYSVDNITNGGGASGLGELGTDTCGSTLNIHPSRCNTADYIIAVNNNKLCGFADWRLPTIRELQSIVHYGRHNPAVDIIYFPTIIADDIYPTPFISSTTTVPVPSGAWAIRFSDGTIYAIVKASTQSSVMLVRGPQL